MKYSSILSFLFIALFFNTLKAQDQSAATEFSIDYEKFTLNIWLRSHSSRG